MIIPEREFVSNVLLEVVRSGGVFGRVRVSWQTTGEHTQSEVTPTSGEVRTHIVISPGLHPSFSSMRLVGHPSMRTTVSSQELKSLCACASSYVHTVTLSLTELSL